MKDYLFLLRGGESRFKKLTKAQNKAHMERWGVYMNDLGQRGHLVGGLPLDSNGRVVRSKGRKVEKTSYKAGSPVNGYLMVKAKDYQQAVKLAGECPSFEHGGSIEIREIKPM